MGVRKGGSVPLKPSGPYTSGQLAKMFGVATRTFNNWADDGLIECYRLPPIRSQSSGKHRRFTREAVLAFLDKNPTLPRPDLFVVDAGTV